MQAGCNRTGCGGPSLSKLYPSPSKPMRWIPDGNAADPSDEEGLRGTRQLAA